jgi:DNA primase
MLREIIEARLTAMNVPYESVAYSDWVKIKCLSPEHEDSKPSAGINVESGIHHCFSCGYNMLFIKQEEDADDADVIWKAKYQNLKKSLQDTYDDFDSIHETIMDREKQLVTPPVDHYITEEWRGITPELLKDCGTYYCSKGKYKGRYIFPAISHGKLYGFDGRIVDASAQMVGAKWVRPRGMDVKSLVYPLDVLTTRFDDLAHIVICEGVMDAVSYIQMGVPAIASFGLTPPAMGRIEELIRMGTTKITLAFDNDEPGIKGTLKVLPAYAEWFEIVNHPMVDLVRSSGHNDANDFLVEMKTNGMQQQDTGWDDECDEF